MQIGIDYGRAHLDLEVPERQWVGVDRQAPAAPLGDIAAAVRAALETPLGFPALRRALTPDDHVAIIVDEHLPRLAGLLTPILEYLVEARVAPEAITLVCPPFSQGQPWLNELPDDFQDVHIEVHDPGDRRKLSYLAATRKGRRVYLNRSAVDADQLVVLSGRGYDPVLGYAGAEGAIYPIFSDEATRRELGSQFSLNVPAAEPGIIRQEAQEVAWLLGAPFFLQVIEGAGEEVLHVIGGLKDTSAEGQRLLDARWRVSADRAAGTVVAGVSGDPARHGFADLAGALACAARVVQPGGRIVLLSQAAPHLGAVGELLRQAEEPAQALDMLRRQQPAEAAAAFQWASAAQHAHIFLLSGLAPEIAEELFVTPLEHAGQAQRLLSGEAPCLVLADAHKTLAVVRS